MLIFEESTTDPPAIREPTATGAGLSAPSKDAAKKKAMRLSKRLLNVTHAIRSLNYFSNNGREIFTNVLSTGRLLAGRNCSE